MNRTGGMSGGVARADAREKSGLGLRVCAVVLSLLMTLFMTGCFVAPSPISEAEHWERMVDDTSSLYLGQSMPTWQISLPEAIARAIKYNLEHRLSMMEGAFQMAQLDVANLNMLPRLALNSGYSIRSNEAASRSISYSERKQSLEPSVSSEVHRINADLSFSWSMLDFGLSYFQARQQADRFLIMKERRRRIMNNLIKDVIIDYFRVASFEKAQPTVEETMKKAQDALETYKKIELEKKAPLAQTLEQERALITIIGHLKSLQTQLSASKARLAALMNMPLNYPYTVVQPADDEMIPPELIARLDDLETIGVYLRPDLREETYQTRIDKTEIKKEMLRMIPGLDLFSNGMYDSNKYLTHNWWAEAGAKVSMDIIGLAGKWKNVKNSKTQAIISRYRRMASTVAAMVQINMGYHQYQQAVESYKDSLQLHRIDDKLLKLSQASAKAKEGSALEQVRQAAVTLNSRLDRDRSLIDVFTAWGNLYFSVGGDILVGVHGTEDLATLTEAASASIVRWLNGGLPDLPNQCPSLQDGALANQYIAMGRVPAVFMPSDDPAAAEAFKYEEERLVKARKEREDRETKRKRESEEKKAAKTKAADLKRPDRKALRERQREEVRKAGEKDKKDSGAGEKGAQARPDLKRPARKTAGMAEKNGKSEKVEKSEKSDVRPKAEVLKSPQVK